VTIFKKLIEIVFSPIGIMTLCFAAGAVLSVGRRGSVLGRRLVWSGVWLYLIFLIAPLAEILVASLERPYPPMLRPDSRAGIRTIVVLSGYGEDYRFVPVTSKLTGETIARLVEGIRLYRELPGARLLVSGGVLRAGNPPVGKLMADFTQAMGVPAADIVIEHKSKTTYENFAEVKKLIGTEPFILVTSACHLRRSIAVAQKLGMQPLPAPAAIWAAQHCPADGSWLHWGRWFIQGLATPSTSRFGYLQLAYHEYVGYVWYWFLGHV
jgi:uncharacterized SAM-binding protein YcdF (DUF218 family)